MPIKNGESPRFARRADEKGLLVACQEGNTVLVRELQAKGGKRMPAPDYSGDIRSPSNKR